MSSHGTSGDDDAEEELFSAVPVTRWWTTSLVVLAAMLFLELGIHPAVAAVMLCFKLSLPDLLNAWWLVRSDPQRKRGLIVAAFYVARSFWGVVAWSVAILVAIVGALSLFEGVGGNAKGVDLVLGALAITFATMFLVAGVFTASAGIAAAVFRVPIWLGPGLTAWRQARRFPPFDGVVQPPRNMLVLFIGFGTAILAAIGMLMAILWVANLANQGPAFKPDLEFLIAVLLTHLAPMGTTLSGMAIYRRINCRTPAECWNGLDGDQPPTSQTSDIESGRNDSDISFTT